MLDYQSIMNLYMRIHRLIWIMLFGSNFKRFGRKSSIQFPLRIQNAKYIEIGNNVSIMKKAWLVAIKIDHHTPSLSIGNGTRIGHYFLISSVRDVKIGEKVLIADKVYISDNLHSYEDVTIPIMSQPTVFKRSVHIGDESWIGEKVSIIGASIGKHSVIGANSVVTKDIPDYCVAGGTPARVIKRYNFNTKEWQRVD